MAPANTNTCWVVGMLSHQNKSVLASSRLPMLASMQSEKLTNPTIYFISNCAMNRASSSGVSSQPISGMIRQSSAGTSNAFWSVGLKNGAIRPVSSFGDCKTKVYFLESLPKSVAILSDDLIRPVVTSELSPLAMVAMVLTGMSFRTGAAPMVAVPRITITS